MRGRFIALLLGCAAASAQAAPACYSPREIEADQAVQYQTELMVVSSACQVHSYTDFTQRNRLAIIDYQNAMIGHFRRAGERRAEQAFETYLTHLANESAYRAGQLSPETLCNGSAGWLRVADALGPADFRSMVTKRAAARSSTYQHCSE